MQTKQIKIYLSYNLKLRTDLYGTSSKIFLKDELVKPAYKFKKLVSETSSKMQEFKTNNKTLNDPIHGNR